MPEYLAPGVYLEESDAGVNPIPGVSTSTIDIETAQALVAAIESDHRANATKLDALQRR